MKSTTKRASKKIADSEARTTEYYESRIVEALSLDADIKAKKERLDAIKKEFMDVFKSPDKVVNSIVTKVGTAVLKLTNSYSIDPGCVAKLRKAYKTEFSVFVNEKITYAPTPALRNFLSDGDYRHKDLIREAVIIKESPSVVFEPIAEPKARAKRA